MNPRLVFIFCITIPFVCSIAQTNLSTFYQDYLDKKRTNDAFFQNVEGSRYENENFTEAEVYLKGNDAAKKFFLRYNNLMDEMEMKNETNNDYLVVNNKDLIDSIVLNDELYVYLDFTENKKPTKGFFIRLTNGKLTLLQRRLKEFIPERKPTGGYQEYVKASIVPKPIAFFLITGNGKPELLPETMSSIVKFLQKKGFDVTKTMKDNRIKMKKENLVELIQLIN